MPRMPRPSASRTQPETPPRRIEGPPHPATLQVSGPLDTDGTHPVDASAPDPSWLDTALGALFHLADTRPTVAADDLHGVIAEPRHPNHWGSVFHIAHAAGLIEPVGYVTSSRPVRHRGVQRVWTRTPLNGGDAA